MFIETPTFPDGISYHARGGLTHQVTVVTTDGGWEYRNTAISFPLRKYVVSFDARLASVFQPLKPFFAVAEGKLNSFRVRDWSDYQHSDAGGVATITAIDSTHWYLSKTYTAGSHSKVRIINKPRSVSLLGGGSYSLDSTTGIVTAATPPTGWTGTFDVPCRFDTDDETTEILDRSMNRELVLGWPDIQLVEVRVA